MVSASDGTTVAAAGAPPPTVPDELELLLDELEELDLARPDELLLELDVAWPDELLLELDVAWPDELLLEELDIPPPEELAAMPLEELER